ncbi:hypothetical protein, variant [Cladophialophora immunda]|uniref:MYND-type domain-containing protein n=1 Tax=Cladophialophora immunda TaxID=569365 RepID=A0A0D2ABC6_9EURO|nr:hypothetical protein, variant [Cladophialophora immunda]KIW22047.1 hypothetical protein, variant [Cladophialophora immunda]
MSSIPCANWQAHRSETCSGVGQLACGGCRLVSYCAKDCQKEHWAEHKVHCKSPLMKSSWLPTWETEGRPPSFVGAGPPAVSYGRLQKYFWGNMPALDVLALDRNEGCSYDRDLHVLFAASGDIRNVLKTVACLPDEYRQSISLILNDRDFDIVARNLIMLLAALQIDKDPNDIETIIHVWYSAKLQSSRLRQLQSSILPLFQEVCVKIKSKPNGTLLGKTWTFGSRSLRVTLSKEKWMLLPSFLEVPNGLSCSLADKIRNLTTLAHERKDYRDRNTLLQKPPHRVCKQRFREDGILLSFAQPRQGFDSPNPTFSQNKEQWLMMDSADPFDGWDLRSVLQRSYGSATNDMYGKLFNHLRDLLSSFARQAASRKMAFELFNADVNDLPRQLGSRQFARIGVMVERMCCRHSADQFCRSLIFRIAATSE